jgi:two-component system sensor histidine kinase KdpD
VSAQTTTFERRPTPRLTFSLVAPLSEGARAGLLRRLNSRAAAALPGGLALAGVAVVTWASFALGQSFAFTGFVYLVPVVLAALYGGFVQATLISVAASACLNYFFVPPIFSFANSTANWVALGAFEFTALVISRLSFQARMRALEAIAGRRDMERLYETSRRILLQDGAGAAGRIASLIRETFDLRGVLLFDGIAGVHHSCGEMPGETEMQTRGAGAADRDHYDPAAKSWYCPLRMGSRTVGSLALHGTAMSRLAATALASLCDIALARARALQRECHAEAVRETEQLRTAVLDALAHQFKTPIAIARTASSGLLAVGELSELQTELVTTVDRQVRKLDEVASRLLGAAMLDAAEFKPQCEPVLFSRIARAAIRKRGEAVDRDRFRLSAPADELPVFADRELILTATNELIDNALRYSEADSTIDVAVSMEQLQVVLRVRSKGVVVRREDCERIFERFYRAPEARQWSAGTGLGLSVVRQIVAAHNGSVRAVGEHNYGTSFFMALPAAAGL